MSLKERADFLRRLLLRKQAIEITEILFFLTDSFFYTENKKVHIICSLWEAAVRNTENFLLNSQPDLKQIKICHIGIGPPKQKFVEVIHDCHHIKRRNY